MFGAFRGTSPVSGGLLWKIRWRLTSTQKASQRHRMRRVDANIAACAESGHMTQSLEEAMALPKESEMLAKDKYTVYSRHHRGFRKGIHKVPKWTRLTLRENPKGF